MSRVGKKEIVCPQKVSVSKINSFSLEVKGPLGVLKKQFNNKVSIQILDNVIKVLPNDNSIFAKSMWGTARSIINSMVIGVTKGFSQKIEIVGVGYRAAIDGQYLDLVLGKSHVTKIEIPSYIKVSIIKPALIEIFSIDKEKLGMFCASIRSQRIPEPYKGKGIILEGEFVNRKKAKKTK